MNETPAAAQNLKRCHSEVAVRTRRCFLRRPIAFYLNVVGYFSVVDRNFELSLARLGGVHPKLTGLADHAVAGLGDSYQTAALKLKRSRLS